MIGARIRQARLAACLSLEELAAKLDRTLSKQALSKYETDKAEPSTSTVMDLARALGVKPSFFFESPKIAVTWVAFRKHASLSVKKQETITAIAEKHLENEVTLRELFHVGLNHSLPRNLPFKDEESAESAAGEVRTKWGLGDLPISGVIETIEDHGGIVLTRDEDRKFSGLSGWTEEGYPVIVINSEGSADRRRYDSSHELGHLVMSPRTPEDLWESLAHRFAAAFLVPRDAVYRELGHRRRTLSMQELGLLKQRWGLSMAAWIRRAHDLRIIDARHYRQLNIEVRRRGWYRLEPYPYEAMEEPILLRRLVSRAVTERIMSSTDAERICPGFETAPAEVSLRQLARLPRDERNRTLSEAHWGVDQYEVDEWGELPWPEDEESGVS